MKDQIMRSGIKLLAIFILTIAAGLAVTAQSVMIVDRGLPTSGLNGPDITPRSNASLGLPYVWQGFFGDDFTVPQPPASGNWRIDTIRVWFVGGPANNDMDLTNDSFLGNLSLGYLSLWVGTNNNLLTKVAQTDFRQPGSDAARNPHVVATRVQYAQNPLLGEFDYYNLPPRCSPLNYCVTPPEGYSTMVQLDFKNLNLTYPAGTLVRFGMFATGAGVFTHASNAGLGGVTADSADDYLARYGFQAGKAYLGTLWQTYPESQYFDKPLDMNVQVFATFVRSRK